MAKLTQILPVMMLSQMSRRKIFLLIPFVVIVLLISAAYAPGQGNSLSRFISSATVTFQSWRNQATLSLDKDYRDVIYPNRNLFYGPWKANVPSVVTAGEEFTMEFVCTNPNEKMCPTYYQVLFHGPTKLSIPPENFGELNRTNQSPFQYASVKATYTILDPGRYGVYAYPELYYCSQWNKMEYPWHRGMVEGCPIDIRVLPGSKKVVEGWGSCTSKTIHDGRYVAVDSSPELSEMYQHTNRSYIYAPYDCKIPARSIPQALAELPSAKHILYIGDSVTRNPFCNHIWRRIHGTVMDSACDPARESYHYSHKFTSITVDDGRQVNFSFLWSPGWETFRTKNVEILLAMDPLPTHIVMNFGLWIANVDAEALQKHFWDGLVYLNENLPSLQHIVLKTPASVVQAVDCRGKDYNPDHTPPDDSLDFRFGASRKRWAIYDLAKTWNEGTGVRVSVVDAWEITDPRPETTSDGRHYSSDNPKIGEQRRYVGEADGKIGKFGRKLILACLQDVIFDEFIHERKTV